MIKISKLADYATLILAIMAETPQEVKSAAVLSKESGLPEPTVSKILKILSGGKIIDSIRGAGGGYRLGKGLENIGVLDIITCVDGPVSVVDCVSGDDSGCRLRGACVLHGRWDRVNDAIVSVLKDMSLADMLKEKDKCCHGRN